LKIVGLKFEAVKISTQVVFQRPFHTPPLSSGANYNLVNQTPVFCTKALKVKKVKPDSPSRQ